MRFISVLYYFSTYYLNKEQVFQYLMVSSFNIPSKKSALVILPKTALWPFPALWPQQHFFFVASSWLTGSARLTSWSRFDHPGAQKLEKNTARLVLSLWFFHGNFRAQASRTVRTPWMMKPDLVGGFQPFVVFPRLWDGWLINWYFS